MAWLQTEYDTALGCAGQSNTAPEQRGTQPPLLDPNVHFQQSEVLHGMQPHPLPQNVPQFAWSDFSPRSISDPSAANGSVPGANPSPDSHICKDLSRTEHPLGTAAAFTCASNQLQLPSGFVGVDYTIAPTYTIPTPMGPPGTQRFDPASLLPYTQPPAPKPLPPLPPKMKRGRGAPRKTAKAKAATAAAAVAAKAPSARTAGVKPTASRPTPAVSTEEKRRVRAERNRESAEKSRLRRKKYTEDLEKDVGSLRETNKTLKSRTERLLAMLHEVDVDVDHCVARGEGFPVDAPNGGTALKTALLALENVKQQCPMTFADTSQRVQIGGSSSASKGK